MLKIEQLEGKNVVVDEETGEILSKDLTPKFAEYDYFDSWNKDGIKFLEPMSCQTMGKLENCTITEEQVAEQKYDGHRCLSFATYKGNRFFSRVQSKKTGWYSENTDCMPHLRDFKAPKELEGTVIDGELLMPSGEFEDVQGVTGALPANAIKKQIECGCAILNAFDILYYKGIRIQSMPLWKRKMYLYDYLKELQCPNIVQAPLYYVIETPTIRKLIDYGVPCIKVNSFIELRDDMWEKGLEGLVIKEINSKYEQKRSKSWLKVKECLTFDVVIMGYQEPTREFTGKTDREKWEYWETMDYGDSIAVTKPYAKGWVGAIICGLYRDGELVATTEVKGITDKNQEYIKAHREELIGKVIEVKAQKILDPEKRSLRHPRFNRWRNDKSAEMCQWEEFCL